jgi:lysophospholipase L1-like esterase
MRVLIFGDSITQGHWDTEGGWVDKLRKHYDELQVQDFDKDQPTIFNLGISADTSREILARVEAEVLVRTRHNVLPIVIVQIGINDSYSDGKAVAVPIDEYKDNLVAIIEKLKPTSAKIIFVGLSACDEAKTTPVAWGEYYYTNQNIKTYEDQMRSVATEHDVAFIPVFERFLSATKLEELLADGLHLNNRGHRVIFDIVKPKLLTLIEKGS